MIHFKRKQNSAIKSTHNFSNCSCFTHRTIVSNYISKYVSKTWISVDSHGTTVRMLSMTIPDMQILNGTLGVGNLKAQGRCRGLNVVPSCSYEATSYSLDHILLL